MVIPPWFFTAMVLFFAEKCASARTSRRFRKSQIEPVDRRGVLAEHALPGAGGVHQHGVEDGAGGADQLLRVLQH